MTEYIRVKDIEELEGDDRLKAEIIGLIEKKKLEKVEI